MKCTKFKLFGVLFILFITTLIGYSSNFLTGEQTDVSNSTEFKIPKLTLERMALLLQNPKIPSPSFSYPWNGLELQLHQFSTGKLPLIGYGSLLNPRSAARTISNTPNHGHPAVLAMGAVRLFNYKMPPQALTRYPKSSDSLATAALNLNYSRSASDLFNGRLIFVAPSDLNALREREKGYDLEPVVYLPWKKWNDKPQVAYVLVARNKPGQPIVVDLKQHPQKQYAALCEEGAKLESQEFKNFYLKTTFLADGKTTLWQSSTDCANNIRLSP